MDKRAITPRLKLINSTPSTSTQLSQRVNWYDSPQISSQRQARLQGRNAFTSPDSPTRSSQRLRISENSTPRTYLRPRTNRRSLVESQEINKSPKDPPKSSKVAAFPPTPSRKRGLKSPKNPQNVKKLKPKPIEAENGYDSFDDDDLSAGMSTYMSQFIASQVNH